MQFSEIANILGANNNYTIDTPIRWLLTDSRTLSFPTESIFFAIRTERNDGHKYIEELYKKNMRYFVVSQKLPVFDTLTDAIFLLVNDTLQALQTLVATHRATFNIPIIGITGSNGKTVVKEWLYQLLHKDFNIVRSPRSYNSQIGVPLSVWALHKGAALGIFEAGISKMHEMQNLQSIIQPTIGIFTNIGVAHQENFTGLKQKCAEKLLLFKQSKVLIYCCDDKLIEIAIAQSSFAGELFGWGKSKKVSLQIVSIEKTTLNTRLQLRYKDTIFDFQIPFIDEASIENAMQCMATLLYLGIQPTEIANRIAKLEAVAMRMEVKQGLNGCLIINDSYNSDMYAMGIALDFLHQQATDKKLSKTAIISDILETGLPPNELYQQLATLLVQKKIQHIIGIGKGISAYTELFTDIEKDFFLTTDEFLQSALWQSFRNAIILLKGARNFHFERILRKLEHTTHETVLEINLHALIDNLNYFRSKLASETKIMCMVKAFGYGSGAVEIARTLQHHRCDYLAVAVADEGAELRREGISLPILVMNPEQNSFDAIFDHTLEPEIYSFRLLDMCIASAEKLGLTDYPIHIKIDTGMHRLGFDPKDLAQLFHRLKTQQQVRVRSVFSHLAAADQVAFDAFTQQQISTFNACIEQFTANFSHHIFYHILNSAGIERFPQAQYNLVRLGIGHFGISVLPDMQLQPVCALYTTILQIKTIPTGQTVGYNCKGIENYDRRIAIIPIGYADGFDRKLGNGIGKVYIRGHRANIVGDVCMDLCMVDITAISAKEGDRVEIFGNTISLNEVAKWLHTIPYEILTSISRRVKRVYFQE